MYRVTVTQDPLKPSSVRYQGEDFEKAYEEFRDICDSPHTTCSEIMVWEISRDPRQPSRKGSWKTQQLYKKYR